MKADMSGCSERQQSLIGLVSKGIEGRGASLQYRSLSLCKGASGLSLACSWAPPLAPETRHLPGGSHPVAVVLTGPGCDRHLTTGDAWL